MSAWSSLSDFVSRNRAAAIVTATVLAVGTGAGIYYVANSQSSLSSGLRSKGESATEAGSASSGAGEKKSKKKSKKKKNGAATSANGTGSASSGSSGSGSGSGSGQLPDLATIESLELLDDIPDEDRKQMAGSLKQAGNEAFNAKKYEEAIDYYTKAIKFDGSDPIFLSNRAACYAALQKYEQVIEDTTKALEIKPDYVKCLQRRAVAYEKIENYPEAILDFTSTCILSDFQDKSLNNAVDRVLRQNSEKIAAEKYRGVPKALPSASFISSYLGSFRTRELPSDVVNAEEGTGDYDLKLAFDALSQETYDSYKQAFELFESAVEKGAESTKQLALAYEYRGTFKFLISDVEGALKDIEESIKLAPTVQAYIKLSSIHMEKGNVSSANLEFSNAIKLDETSADVYYHRAQIAFLTADFQAAITDYEKSISLDSGFMYAHIQLAVAEYRMGSTSAAIEAFGKLLRDYSNSSEVHNYFGEVLLDQGNAELAVKEFDTAIDLEKNKGKGSVNVLPLVNKALTVFQKSQDINEAVSLCRKAVALDPLSDIAIGTLAQFCLQQNNTKEALELFLRNADIARTEPEQIQALSFAEAARTQLRIISERPKLRERLELLTRQGGL